MLPTWTPRPTWMGLMPPRLFCGAVPAVRVWLRMSWKTSAEALKPGVLEFAMLLPITSSHVWWFVSPETAENSERVMCVSLLCGGSRPLLPDVHDVLGSNERGAQAVAERAAPHLESGERALGGTGD